MENPLTAGEESDPFCSSCTTSRKKLDDLAEENERLFQMLEISKSENNQLKRDVRSMQSQLFDKKEELKKADEDRRKFKEIQDENVKLHKQNILLGEMFNSTKEKLDCINSNFFIKQQNVFSLNMKVQNLERCLFDYKSRLDSKSRDHDYYKGKTAELEEEIQEKNGCLNSAKESLKRCHQKHQEHIKCLEKSMKPQANMIARLQSHIIDVNSQLGIHINQQQLESKQYFQKTCSDYLFGTAMIRAETDLDSPDLDQPDDNASNNDG